MNPKLQKTVKEIERTKAKIAELQKRLPLLEKRRADMENTEIVRMFRSVCVTPADFSAFVEAYGNRVPAKAQERENAGSIGGEKDEEAPNDADL